MRGSADRMSQLLQATQAQLGVMLGALPHLARFYGRQLVPNNLELTADVRAFYEYLSQAEHQTSSLEARQLAHDMRMGSSAAASAFIENLAATADAPQQSIHILRCTLVLLRVGFAALTEAATPWAG